MREPFREQPFRDIARPADSPPLDQHLGTGPRPRDRRGVGPGTTFRAVRRGRWPRIHWRSVTAVGVGGFFGGLARYGLELAWPPHQHAFPWATFTINTSGAFLLALLLILVLDVLPPTTYLRSGLGTGFFGSYTTFSSVAIVSDQFVAHGRAPLAVGYVCASVLAGLAAASFGVVLGRSIAVSRKE